MSISANTNYAIQRTTNLSLGPTAQDGPGADGSATALLPNPVPCGLSDGSLTELSMLLTQADEQDRAASRKLETTADQAATEEENQRVAQLQAKAQDDMNQALASGIGGIAGGVCTIVAGFTVAPAGSSATGPAGAAQSTDPRAIWTGMGSIVAKGGDLVAGLAKNSADKDDASAASFDAQSQSDLRRYNEAHDDVQASNQSMQKVEQFLDQVQQTENATRLSAATFRG
jgi:hypothetical protein